MMPTADCCLCKRPFQFGGGVYRGKLIVEWRGLMICNVCDSANHDGIVPRTYPHLMPRLAELGIKPEVNDQGWIVLPR